MARTHMNVSYVCDRKWLVVAPTAIRVACVIAFLPLMLGLSRMSKAQTLTTLYSFYANGAQPYAGLIQASDGNFYGTTSASGVGLGGYGTVYRMTATGAVTVLHSFSGPDGSTPYSGLVQASDGNLYGTTYSGGANSLGTVYQITTGGVLTTLYSFTASDGNQPTGGLLQAADGNLYGTTYLGGAYGHGSVYKITTSGAFTTIYNFSGGSDGSGSEAPLIQAPDGTFYGVSGSAGAYGYGTVFHITTGGSLTTLYSFTGGSDGSYPNEALIMASDGNLYGATLEGGADSLGTIFQITTAGSLTTLHTFTGGTDGANPGAGLIQASDGTLCGVTEVGGANSQGVVFQITTAGVLTTLHSFTGADGYYPSAVLMQASDGN
ncbi:MAG TPA: choice-of-anchor tandem repeat GloVer-containing protein, partial [Chthonomonadales bacterium]|nr:choice-of-anchor tandem repeat GloVer-containing protein [Chthonomonadales bacterium]